MAIIIKTTGETIEVKPKNGTDFQLKELQEVVGGYIQILHIYRTGELMVVNDEGRLEGLPRNGKATTYAKQYNAIFPNDYIAGNVLVCDQEQIKSLLSR